MLKITSKQKSYCFLNSSMRPSHTHTSSIKHGLLKILGFYPFVASYLLQGNYGLRVRLTQVYIKNLETILQRLEDQALEKYETP